jgi:endonuclease YncB( thermonuclease family)
MELIAYRYFASVSRVIDGDTAELIIDEGFKHSWKVTCRFAGINTPELTSADLTEKAKAVEARDYLAARLPVGKQVYIISEKLDKYGRPITTVFDLDGTNINDEMLQKGYAKKYT